MKEDAAGSSETLITIDQTVWCGVSKDSDLQDKNWFLLLDLLTAVDIPDPTPYFTYLWVLYYMFSRMIII